MEIEGSTRKGPGQVIAEFTARVRYEIMPSPAYEFSPHRLRPHGVRLVRYLSKDDESAGDQAKIERVLLKMAETLSGWTHEVAAKVTDNGIAWHALMVRGMGTMVRKVEVRNGILILQSDSEESQAGTGYLKVQASEKDVARFAEESVKRIKNQRVLQVLNAFRTFD